MASYPNTFHNTTKEMLANPNLHQAIAQAIVHAREVCGREHIKGDRHERVRQFCNSLRSFVSGRFNRGVVAASGLLAHRMWCDAGVLATENHIRAVINGIDTQDIRNCVMKAEQYLPSEEDEEKTILRQLQDLNNSVEAQKANVERMGRHSVEAAGIMNELESLNKEIAELEQS